jgi:L-seryl-tRNA(Ser) seleniumtransferase
MDPRRSIPAVERLLSHEAFASLCAAAPRTLIIEMLQHVQDEIRLNPERHPAEHPPEWYARMTSQKIDALRKTTLRRVINATGVVLHTNLGRAPLADEAIDAMRNAATGYTTLEYDVASGRRGSRYDHCARLLRQLTGAPDALVVNNNAAALVLALNTFARAKTAIVSRGELVEIGGSFRVPDIMARSGARMLEVGSTNRTHAPDYATAVDNRTGAILKVHRSNFHVHGYTADTAMTDLAAIASQHGVPLIYDLGSGLLDDAAAIGLPDEPTARDALRDGASIITLSGDKLLGGPQAGIILGSVDAIKAMKKNPLCRAMRVDKLTLAALEATLILHLDPDVARERIPALRMLTLPRATIHTRAHACANALRAAGVAATCIDGVSAVGGGAAPDASLETVLIALASTQGRTQSGTQGGTAARIEKRLRAAATPIIARIENDTVLLDVRTVAPDEEEELIAGVIAACSDMKAATP